MARPTLYQSTFPDRAKKLCRLGLTNQELAVAFGVATATISKWMTDYPEFSDAIKEGRDQSDAVVADRLYNRAIGYEHKAVKIFNNNGTPLIVEYIEHYPPDPVAAIFWLCNRRPDKWKRNQTADAGTNDVPKPVKVTVKTVNAAKNEPDT